MVKIKKLRKYAIHQSFNLTITAKQHDEIIRIGNSGRVKKIIKMEYKK